MRVFTEHDRSISAAVTIFFATQWNLSAVLFSCNHQPPVAVIFNSVAVLLC
jgi:hypothetical protein